MQQINRSTLQFLKDLKKNNNRPWFTEHKPTYAKAQANVKDFMQELELRLSEHDVIEGHRVYRIYRDVRFSKDKTPYKSGLGCGFTRATEARRGGLYVQIEPGNSFVGGGFWGPSAPDLRRIRNEIAVDAAPLRKVLADTSFKYLFGSLQGQTLKTAPKGFDKEHPDIDLLRYKQFLVSRTFTDKEVLSESFLEECDLTFRAMRPFFDFMSLTLTTDENGESIL